MSTEPEIARGEPFNVREAIAALDYHASKAAKRGDYGAHSDLMVVRDVVEELAERCTMAVGKAEELAATVLEAQRTVRASLESLSKLPS